MTREVGQGFCPAVPRGSAERSPKGLPHWP